MIMVMIKSRYDVVQGGDQFNNYVTVMVMMMSRKSSLKKGKRIARVTRRCGHGYDQKWR